jgi:glutamyl-tRNA(Gln) amidotransferase subunit D
MKPSVGDIVLVTRGKEKFKGTLMQSTDLNVILIKLDNGYNIGIKKQASKIKVLKAFIGGKSFKKSDVVWDKSLPLVSVLHTGGTIASKVDYKTGGVVAKFTPEDLVGSIPELNEICRVRSTLVANLQSESMRFGHYNLIAKAVEKELKAKEKPKGIIVTHGTDTLHYTAAALTFSLENVPIPVILVGAQRSSDRGSSDAVMNVKSAARFITQTDFKGVAICMHKNLDDDLGIILPSCKTRKLHTSRRDAFKSVNAEAIAEVGEKVRFLSEDYYRPRGDFKVRPFKDVKVGLLKTHTNMFPEDYLHFSGYAGLIVEGTGLGHAQTTGFDEISKINESNKKALKKVAEKTVVVMASQCIFGRINMNVYSPQRELLEIGVIPAEDMTPETALIKLSWLLSNYPENVREKFEKNLRGEISERILPDEEFLKI